MGYHIVSSKKPKRNLGDIPEHHLVLELDQKDAAKFLEIFLPDTKNAIEEQLRIFRVKVQVSLEEFSNHRNDQMSHNAWKEKD